MKKYIISFIFIIFTVSLFFIKDCSWADDRTGRVISIRDGKLERLVDGAWQEVKKGSAISFGDRLRTDKKALAVVEMPNIGRLVIGPGSEIELGKESKDFKGNLARGAIWLNSNLPKDGKASITTSLATAGIRGTKFTVCYDGKAFCACTCIGEVEVLPNSGKTIKVPAGAYYAFTEGAPLPEKTKPARPELEKQSAGFEFCFTCHVAGGKGELKRNWEQSIPLQ